MGWNNKKFERIMNGWIFLFNFPEENFKIIRTGKWMIFQSFNSLNEFEDYKKKIEFFMKNEKDIFEVKTIDNFWNPFISKATIVFCFYTNIGTLTKKENINIGFKLIKEFNLNKISYKTDEMTLKGQNKSLYTIKLAVNN